MKLSDQWELINRARLDPPVNLERLADALGVKLKYAYLDDAISGMIETIRGGYLVTVNALHPVSRQRFTIAHELGHYMFHRTEIGDGLDDDRLYRSTNVGKYHNTAIGPAEETEANKFAANLLMPQELVDIMWREDGTNIEKMAEKFGVSKAAMKIRLGINS